MARRIAAERQSRGLSYEGLAKLMTDAGCAIQGSGIYKIERADPPRRITVNELVGFAQVFGQSVENLLTPMEVLELDQAREVLKELDKADAECLSALARSLMLYVDFYILAAGHPDLADYIDGHRLHWTEDADLAGTNALFMLRDATGNGQLLDALSNLWSCLRSDAKVVADAHRSAPAGETSTPVAANVTTDPESIQEISCP